jgi:hypothetical protein
MESQSQESKPQDFKTKMKVSNPLNDIAANLGVTPKVLTQLATGDDKEFRELVRGIFSILPEDEVAMVATDASINSEFLDYLSRLFEDNQRILMTILHNPSANSQTKYQILEKLPENIVSSIASNSKTSSDVLLAISECYKESPDMLANLLANSATPENLKELIISESSAKEMITPDLEEITEESFALSATEALSSEADEVDAKIALCVDKLYGINADIVTEFIKKARSEIVKRLTLMAKANRLILKTIVKHPSLTIEELERIDLDMFVSLLKKSPGKIDDQTVLKLLQQAKKNGKK